MAEPTSSPPPTPPPPPQKHSFWEKLGQTVTHGWEKTKEVSTRLGEIAVLKLDLKNARDHLETRYRALGLTAADRLIDRGETALDASEPGVRAALDEVRSARSAIAALEKKLAEAHASQGHGPGPAPGGEAAPGTGGPAASGTPPGSESPPSSPG